MQPDAHPCEIRRATSYVPSPGAPSAALHGREVLSNTFTDPRSGRKSGETHPYCALCAPPLLSTGLCLPVKFVLLPINCPSKLRSFPQQSVFVGFASVCGHKVSIKWENIFGSQICLGKLKFPLVYGAKWSL